MPIARVSLNNPASWPRNVRRATEGIASMLMHAFLLVRSRALSSPSRIVRRLARGCKYLWDLRLLRRENRILRRRLRRCEPHKRPHYAPADRFLILILLRIRGWTAKRTARRFVLHHNTILAWLRELRGHANPGLFLGRAPFNKLGEASRWVVHQIRELCPEPRFGTRSIAMAIARNGIALSRSTVQRVLREPKPPRPSAPVAKEDAAEVPPHHILRPKAVNRTWHLDLTTFEFLWIRFYVAALLEGFSRKLLALRVYRDAPTTDHMLRIVRRAMREHGTPRFLATDWGTQFRKRFVNAFDPKVTKVVKGKPEKEAACRFNGKAERFVKSLKLWSRLTLFAWKIPSIQRQLDIYREWFNTARPMWLHGGRTPEEVWANIPAPTTAPIRAHEEQPFVSVRRANFRGDPELPVVKIRSLRSVKRVA